MGDPERSWIAARQRNAAAIGVIAFLAVGCVAGLKPDGASPAAVERNTHRVRLTRNWTPAVLEGLTRRLDTNPLTSVAWLNHPSGRRGWWIVWSDPTRSRSVALGDVWTAEIAARLYRDRRERSAPGVSGIAIATRAPSFAGARAGETTAEWPRPALTYVQGRGEAVRDHVSKAATRLGLRLVSFRLPRLDGMLAPVVHLRVGDEARFERSFNPACLPGWVFGSPTTRPSGGAGPTPYFGYLLSITGFSGRWLQSTAFVPYEVETQLSSRAAKRLRRLTRGQRGVGVCPHRPS